MPDVVAKPVTIPRGTPLIATWPRWALSSAVIALLFAAIHEGIAATPFSHATRGSFGIGFVLACIIEAVLVFAMLRTEESRVARELRTARAGTPALRQMVLRQRPQLAWVARFFSTRLGTAAVLLADGDRDAALQSAAGGSLIMHGGLLESLRTVVEADIDRGSGSPESRVACMKRLRGVGPLPSREAELYRTHVLAKAVLEQGDGEAAAELIAELESAEDDDRRVYAVWLRVWFEEDVEASDYRHAAPAIPEGLLRLATLLARAHGAEKLVAKLEERISAIAQPAVQE